MRNSGKSLYGMVFVGVMAAMVFVTTFFLKIQIPTPTGPTMLKVGNIVCLLSGLMFGGVYGGLASGIGSMLYDLMDPNYIAESPITFINFFLMGFICGLIARRGGRKPLETKNNILAAACGAGAYWLLYIGKNTVKLMLAGSAFWPAFIANSPKMLTSGINAVVAVTCAVLLVKPLYRALGRTGMLEKIGK